MAPPSLTRVVLHWFAHWFGLNTGRVVTRWDRGTLLIGFRCETCGGVSDQDKVLRVDARHRETGSWNSPWQ